jgi:hypothetical protein
MKRAATTVALVLGALIVGGSTAGVHPKLARAQAVKRLGGMLSAKPQNVQLVWADERLTDVMLEWTAYSPHARIHVLGGPVGGSGPADRYYRGPAQASIAADGGPPEGVGSIRPPRNHHVFPLRSDTIPVSLVAALAHNGARVALVPLRVLPTIGRVKALSKLRIWGDRKGRLQGIWLVRFRHGNGRERLAWMAVALHARVPVYSCDEKCKPWYTLPLASFLNARNGKQIEALTINGWKPQLSPRAASSSAPPLSTDLRLTRSFACLDAKRHRVSRRTLRRFHAVTAVECMAGQRVYPGHGQWEVLIRKVAVSSVAGLQRYFERPDGRIAPKKGVACADPYTSIPLPAFADAAGRWVTPVRYPEGVCGAPLGFPPSVRWHVVRVRRIKQLVSAPALAANCAMRVGNTVAWAGPPRDAKAGTRLFERTPKRFHVCVYRTRPGNFATGYFVRGFRLAAARTRRLLAALDGPGPKRGCPKQRTFVAINASRSIGATVELGGCYRVATAEGARTASPAVVRRILGGG